MYTLPEQIKEYIKNPQELAEDAKSYTKGMLKLRHKHHHFIGFIIIVFLLLTSLIYLLPLTFIDINISQELQENQHPILTLLMRFVSFFGVPWVAGVTIAAVPVILYIAKKKRQARYVLLSAAVVLVNTGIKMLIGRARPTDEFVDLFEPTHYDSFPSGHVAYYTCFFGFIVFILLREKYLNPKYRYTISLFLIALILTVPISRIYLGSHWLTDVSGGFFLGIILLYYIVRLYIRKSKEMN